MHQNLSYKIFSSNGNNWDPHPKNQLDFISFEGQGQQQETLERLININYNSLMKPAIFLDRDGVVIENRPAYIRHWKDVEIFPIAVDILSQIASSPFRVVFVTNQSVVGRGIISIDEAQEINRQLVDELGKNGCRVDGVYMCPHAPEERCSCRKPLPGLLFDAARSLNIDLANSIMIGDAWTDLQAGQAAGVVKVGLVLTGRGRQQLNSTRPPELINAPVYNDLAEALEGLLP